MEDSRVATLPKTAEEFQAVLPSDFKPPQGVEFKIDEQDPMMAQYRAFAIEQKFDQTQFSKGLGILAAVRISEKQQVDKFKAAEALKLGATAQTRMDSVTTFIKAVVGDDLGKDLVLNLLTARQFEGWEKVMERVRSQGNGAYTPQHGSPPSDKNEIPGYDKMTFAQRRYAQDQLNPPRAAAR